MKKKGFIIAIAAIVTFILVIIVCAAVAAKQKPSDTPTTEPSVLTLSVTPIHAWED